VPHNRTSYNEFILWIKSLGLPSASWIVDVGANHGDFAQAASTVFPDASILLIEPVPILQSEIERRSSGRALRWFLEPCAAGAHAGTAELVIDPTDDAIGSLAGFSEEYLRANPSVAAGGSVTCIVKPLDKILTDRQIKSVDLVKIDVEGFEFEVLNGFQQFLPLVRSIIIEVSLLRLSKAGAIHPVVAMSSCLTENGFEIVAVIPSLYAARESWRPVEFNILARRLD
jgi:FkbM family methyltransferase